MAVTPPRIVSMSAASCYDPDAITAVSSRRTSFKVNDRLRPSEVISDKDAENSAEGCDDGTLHAAAGSTNIPRTHAEPPTGADSPGYFRMALMRDNILLSERIFVFVAILVLATVQSMDNFMRVLYQVSSPVHTLAPHLTRNSTRLQNITDGAG